MRLIDAGELREKLIALQYTVSPGGMNEACVRTLDEMPTAVEPAYGGVIFLDEGATFGTLYTYICETLVRAGVLEVIPAKADMLTWAWRLKPRKEAAHEQGTEKANPD